MVLGLRLRGRGPGRAAGSLRRQRDGHRKERNGARDRVLEPDELGVQQVREGHRDRRVRRRLALGPPPKRFYRNRDGRHFDELAAVTGLESEANQRGLVVLDADGDGAPDLFATGFLQPRRSGSIGIRRGRRRWSSRSRATRRRPAVSHRRATPSAPSSRSRPAASRARQVVSAGYSFLSSGRGSSSSASAATQGRARHRPLAVRTTSRSAATCRRASSAIREDGVRKSARQPSVWPVQPERFGKKTAICPRVTGLSGQTGADSPDTPP